MAAEPVCPWGSCLLCSAVRADRVRPPRVGGTGLPVKEGGVLDSS